MQDRMFNAYIPGERIVRTLFGHLIEMFFFIIYEDIFGKKKVEEMKLRGSIKLIEEAKQQHLMNELLVIEFPLSYFMLLSDP